MKFRQALKRVNSFRPKTKLNFTNNKQGDFMKPRPVIQIAVILVLCFYTFLIADGRPLDANTFLTAAILWQTTELLISDREKKEKEKQLEQQAKEK